MDIEKLKQEQIKLSKKVLVKDSFDKIGTVGGVDCAYHGDIIIAAIAVCDYSSFEIKEKVFFAAKANVPYIKGFLAYREGPAISEAYAKLQNKPDVLVIDGNGILHPRRFGLASHMGVLLDLPTVGIAKHLLVGEIKESTVYFDKEARAQSIITREHSKPIYVSPGHKISLKKSIEVIKHCIRPPHKMPEPLHLAHRFSDEIREKIAKGEIKI